MATRTVIHHSAQPAGHCDQDDLRTKFALAMSAMYRDEVPLYGDLIRIVRQINDKVTIDKRQAVEERLDLERHGAVRLGTPHELQTVRRVFSLIGLFPVDYYDLSVAGLPMHATAFRPIKEESLARNPFRVFTTLLRPELLTKEAGELATSLLSNRNLFSDELLQLIQLGEQQGGFSVSEGEQFVAEAIKIFKWQAIAAADIEDYEALKTEHPIIADIACFNTAHINHLTPRVLDIDLAETQMRKEGLHVKCRIEGPPVRDNPILLRQTSFLALQEQIKFPSRRLRTGMVDGHHKARFGEIEQRGAAVTARGRRLYDQVLATATQAGANAGTNSDLDEEAFASAFQEGYTDVWRSMVDQGLVFFTLHCTEKAPAWSDSNHEPTPLLSKLLDDGIVRVAPIIYEDFLPFSAAGIFRSNLQSDAQNTNGGSASEPYEDRHGLEAALGCPILDSEKLYASAQEESVLECVRLLKVKEIVPDITG